MSFEDHALCFPCRGTALYGILSMPAQPKSRGVIFIVGGPQYRAGSHRQFTLLARDLAKHGHPVLRFDYRGMGDSEGTARNFEQIDDDIRSAVDTLTEMVPAVEDVVLWGLCDGASAAIFYAHQDRRISGLVLVNPWSRTEESAAKTYLKHYYSSRVMAPELWKKLARGEFDYRAASRSLYSIIRQISGATAGATTNTPLPDRLYHCLSLFSGRVLLILCGNDLTAKEFSDLAGSTTAWRKLMRSPQIQRMELKDANHTFSRATWRKQIASWTRNWLLASTE